MSDESKDKKKKANDDLGGIFGVAASTKKKKKKKKPSEEISEAMEALEGSSSASEASEVSSEASETLDEDSVPFPEEEPGRTAKPEPKAEKPKKKKKSKHSDIEGILTPSTDDSPYADASYLSDDDLDIDVPQSGGANKMMMIVIGLMAVVIVGMGIMMTGSGGDLVALFKGNLREKKIAEARMIEEKHKAEQLAGLDLFGNLMIGGTQYADLKLNGERHYGRTSSGAWRDVRIGAAAGVQNLKVKDAHKVEVSAPGFETQSFDVTQGMWQEGTAGDYVYSLTASLLPKDMNTKQEFDARMSQDAENEFYGKVALNTIPAGATVRFNNKPLLNEKGEELKTPVTFEKWYVKDEAGKLVENQVRVDSALDVGNKIELEFPYETSCPKDNPLEMKCGAADGCCPATCTVATDADCKTPKFVQSLQRQMWTCNWKDGAPPTDIKKDKTIQHYCDYSYSLDLDFNGLKSYIVKREEEHQRIKDQLKAAKAKAEETASK